MHLVENTCKTGTIHSCQLFVVCGVHVGGQADASGQQAQRSKVTLDNIFDGVWVIQEDVADEAVTADDDTVNNEEVRHTDHTDQS